VALFSTLHHDEFRVRRASPAATISYRTILRNRIRGGPLGARRAASTARLVAAL
jgi:hypothetical protein